MTGEVLLWAMIGLPALVGAMLCLAGHRIARSVAGVSVVVAGVGVLLAALVAAARPTVSVAFVADTAFGLSVDTLSAFVVLTVSAVTVLVLVFAAGDVAEAPGRFHGLMLLFLSAVLVTATATTLPTLLLAWEVMGAMSYALIAFAWRRPGKSEAGAVAFLTTRTADLGLYAASAAALAGGAGLALADLPEASSGWRHVVAAGVLVAALGKAAQLPFSFWLSRAMEGPSPVSALLHSAAMVAMGGYLLLRTQELLAATGWADLAAAWAGALTALLLGAVAVAQRDLKQLLAASTSAQLGFVVLAAGVGTVAGGTAHLVAHAATKALLFLAAGCWLSALGSKRLHALVGAARRWPVVGVVAGLGALALAGVPPLSLWATKDEVLVVVRESSVALYAVGLAAAAVSAAYSGRIVAVVWRQLPADAESRYDDEARGTRRVGPLLWGPLLPFAAGAAALGVLALPPLGHSLRRAFGETSQPSATVLEMVVSALIAVTALVVALRWRLPEPGWAAQWLGLESAAHRLVVRPTVGLAHGLARFDDRVLDRSVDRLAAVTASTAGRLGRLDVRGVDGLVEAFARGARGLGGLARLPQTGLLHQYYVQAVALLAAGAVVLVFLG